MVTRPCHLRVFEKLIEFSEVLCNCDESALSSKHHDVEFLVRMVIDDIGVIATQVGD
jgi:hypothetical protein